MILIPGITLKNVTKKFGEVTAIKDVNLKIKDGEFFTLLGPSGCGKSTTLNIIAGLLEQDEGEVWIGDALVSSKKQEIMRDPKDRDIAMTFQDYAIYPHKTVFDNIAFPLEIKGEDEGEIERRVKKTAELLDIVELLDRKPEELSGGQRQRTALGRAIVREPNVFLMDEPLANLDARLRITARGRLRKLQRELGVTTVYVTHDQAEAMTMSDRIAVLKDGVIQEVGKPNEIYNNPSTLFVAKFIGDLPMNMLEGTLVERKGNITIDMGTFSYNLNKGEKILENAESPNVILGIRPEHFKIAKKKKKNAFKGEIDVIETAGREFNIRLTVGENSLLVITEQPDLEVGDEVWLVPDREEIHLFDEKTGKNILPC